MKSQIKAGMQWGPMRVVKSEIVERDEELGPGVKMRWKDERFMLQCECGKTWWVWKKDWKGKRAVKDCGCGLAAQEGRRMMLPVLIGTRQIGWLEKYAGEHEVSRAEVVRRALKLMEDMGE